MNIGNFSVPSNPNRLPRLIEHVKKIYDTYSKKDDVIANAKNNDALAQLLDYKSSNNGAYWSELAAFRAYGLLEGRSDLRVSELAKQITYGNEQQKSEALLKAFLNIPLWKEVYNRYRLQLPTQDFWAKLQNITGCEAPVARSNERFITEAFKEDAKDIRSVQPSTSEEMDLTRPDQETGATPPTTTPQFIELKAGSFYQRIPYTDAGIEMAKPYLSESLLKFLKSQIGTKTETKGEK